MSAREITYHGQVRPKLLCCQAAALRRNPYQRSSRMTMIAAHTQTAPSRQLHPRLQFLLPSRPGKAWHCCGMQGLVGRPDSVYTG